MRGALDAAEVAAAHGGKLLCCGAGRNPEYISNPVQTPRTKGRIDMGHAVCCIGKNVWILLLLLWENECVKYFTHLSEKAKL